LVGPTTPWENDERKIGIARSTYWAGISNNLVAIARHAG
jgi:hypothetical protein